MGDHAWEDRAACTGLDPDLWFPDLDEGGDNHGTTAKAICAQCPVPGPCLEAALERGEEHGIWGGAGGDQMRWLRRKYRAGGTTWTQALAAHIANLTGATNTVIDRNGPNATHGLRVTYNRGCRCRACRWATQDDVALIKQRRRSA